MLKTSAKIPVTRITRNTFSVCWVEDYSFAVLITMKGILFLTSIFMLSLYYKNP